ncbi:BlaI/MecI/CopY family transcriptional regulator [Erysipelotrichaceae bacterium 51-3]|uniref:BlaI/MecI/CopY family transcriptional regulator n=1 Tax=Allobaculum sp. JKK-2023 TaxID=3108943 RepID=UPI002B05E302|nr:BlaI/MecI/CopY family transcriptional regulator [Allobaculum sp. JKK-2023]
MKETGLTKRETQIMNVLWKSDQPLSAFDILTASPDLSRNTIQIVLKKLQTIGFIEVAGFGYHKNALTRTFRPIISQTEYMGESLARSTSLEITKSFIKSLDDCQTLNDLDTLIQEKRKELGC